MSTLSQVSNIVNTFAHQTETRIREGIQQNAQTLQKTVQAAQSAAKSAAYTVEISAAAFQKAAGRG